MYSVWLIFVACILHLTSALDTELSERIVGGKFETDLKQAPFVAFLIRTIEGNIADGCGASILSPKFVLTTAHCIKLCYCDVNVDDNDCLYCDEGGPEDFTVYTGSDVIYQNNKYASFLYRFHIHPEYKTFDRQHECELYNNIALGELKHALSFTDYVNKVTLPEPIAFDQVNDSNVLTTNYANQDFNCKIYGYGETVSGHKPKAFFQGKRLKSLKVHLVYNEHCLTYLYFAHQNLERAYNYSSYGFCSDIELCTIDPKFEKNPCVYDAGGPLICNGTQVGIFSTGVSADCVGKYHPAIYTRVDIYVPWIKYIIEDK